MKIVLSTLAISIMIGLGCQKKKSNSSSGEGSGEIAEQQTTSATTNTNGSGFSTISGGIYLLTPEQVSNQVFAAFGTRLGFELPTGDYYDLIVRSYGLALGGIDFKTVFFRDPIPKVQNLLVVRTLMWNISAMLVTTDNDNAPNAQKVFTEANVQIDRPYIAAIDDSSSISQQDSVREGELRWNNQIESVYWRMFSRPPSLEEMAKIRSAFQSVFLDSGQNNIYTWVVIMYSLMSTAEWWNV